MELEWESWLNFWMLKFSIDSSVIRRAPGRKRCGTAISEKRKAGTLLVPARTPLNQRIFFWDSKKGLHLNFGKNTIERTTPRHWRDFAIKSLFNQVIHFLWEAGARTQLVQAAC